MQEESRGGGHQPRHPQAAVPSVQVDPRQDGHTHRSHQHQQGKGAGKEETTQRVTLRAHPGPQVTSQKKMGQGKGRNQGCLWLFLRDQPSPCDFVIIFHKTLEWKRDRT